MEGTLGEPVLTDTPPPVVDDPGPRRSRALIRLSRVVALLIIATGVYVVWDKIAGENGSYSFAQETPGGDAITWDHCLAIRYHVNPEGAPENWRVVVEGAFAEMSAASKFVFVDAGETGNRSIGPYMPGAARGEPVLIMWSSQGRMHSLQGNTIGLGGGASVDVDGTKRLVTGIVVLDAESHSRAYDPLTTRTQQLVLVHELGHVLGLGHVDDPRQLMNAAYIGQKGLGEGDLAGLEALHAVPCG